MTYLEFVNNNLYLYMTIIVALLVLDIILTIVCINQKKRKKIKKEFENIEKLEEDEIKPEVAFELEQILEQMQQDIDTKPEDVVRRFEEEQEQKAIISYQELVDSVNNNKIDVDDDGEEGNIDFVAALEADNYNNSGNLETIETNGNLDMMDNNESLEDRSHLDVIDEINYEGKDKKFKNSEILSPVFGRMQPDYEYHKIDSFSNTNNKIEIEQVAGNSIDSEIKKNEDFLNALIEFRNNL